MHRNDKQRSQKPRRKRGNRKPTQSSPYETIVSAANSSRIPGSRGMRGPFPQSEIVSFRYTDRIQINSVANSYAVVDFRMNSVWQPRFGGPTGTSSGYVGSAFRYLNYRVENFKFRIRTNSNEPNISLSFGMILNDSQISILLTSFQTALTLLGSPGTYAKGTIGETTGMSRYVSPTFSVSPAKIVGNPLMYYSDRDYTGTLGTPLIAVPINGTNPNQISWGGFVVVSETPAIPITNGLFADFDFEMTTRLFSVNPLA